MTRFLTSPVVPTPTAAFHAATKQYVDDLYDAMNVGKMDDWTGVAEFIPAKHVLAYGQDLNRVTYTKLFEATCPVVTSTATVLASTDVFTSPVAHNFAVGDRIFFETIGAGGAGLTANTVAYFVASVPTSTTFTVSATRTTTTITGVVAVGAAVNVTSDGSGIKIRRCPNGITDGTTFKAFDARGVVMMGLDDMGGVDSARIGWSNVEAVIAGEATHTLLAGESGQPGFTTGNDNIDHSHSGTTGTVSADHTHTITGNFSHAAGSTGTFLARGTGANNSGLISPSLGNSGITVNHTHAFTSGGRSAFHQHSVSAADAVSGHNNIQPSATVPKIIYAGV